MKNPTQGKRLTTPVKNISAAANKQNNAKVRQAVKGLSKQIDRVRKQISRLESDAPYSPALQRANQFMKMNNISKISQTSYIKTPQQLADYKRFLNKFESYDTHTVKGAKKAEKKKLEKLEDIMKENGWDPNDYDVNEFYDRLNKIDMYNIMSDFAIKSDKIIAEVTHIMNTKQGKRVTAQRLLKEIFGNIPAADKSGKKLTKARISGYNKNTKQHQTRKRQYTRKKR